MKKPERKSLGRGLSALLGDLEAEPRAAEAPEGPVRGAAARAVTTLPIERMHPNPDQPRRDFREEDLNELTASIRERGVIQPVIVRPHPERTGEYQIVAGERRWRAAQRAQLHELPVVVRDLDDRTVLEVALIENVQRADLNPLEEAQGYQQLMERFAYTQEALARIVGKSRSHLANTLRLIALPEEVKEFVRAGQLSAGHARALVGAPNAVTLARATAASGLTVRQLEELVRNGPKRGQAAPSRPAREKDPDTAILEGDLSAALGSRVTIEHGKEGGGELRIRYRDLDELDRLCQKFAG